MISGAQRFSFSVWRLLEGGEATRSLRTVVTLLLVVIGPILAFLTFSAFDVVEQDINNDRLRVIIMLDLIYVLVIAALLAARVVTMIAARRAKSAGSRLHLRLTAVFSLVALAPTIIVAVFAVTSINFGLEGWFSQRVQQVVGNSLAAAEAYENEHRENLLRQAGGLSAYLNFLKQDQPFVSVGELREEMTLRQQVLHPDLTEAFIINGSGDLIARGANSYLFDYESPDTVLFTAARDGEIVVIEDWSNSEFRALVHMPAFVDRYLYVTLDVDGSILELLDETRATVGLYQQLEQDRGQLLFEFAVIYLAFALIVILAAIWLGFWFAERLTRPVANLAGAAQRVGAGDLSARVEEEKGEDEIAMLGRVFNRMTDQVRQQQEAMVIASRESDQRRRIFEAVLSGVTAGVIGLDPESRVEVVNDAARELLFLNSDAIMGLTLSEALPTFAPLLQKMQVEHRMTIQDQVHITTQRREEDLLIRITRHAIGEGRFGYVVTFDSITDLISAQRMAAWGDVARRIAHEIKNPLTPIQLAAERMKRKYGKDLTGEERQNFEQYTDVIIRQTNDLRRIVDEFSKFARLPQPEREEQDIRPVLQDALVLRNEAAEGIVFDYDLPAEPVIVSFDATLMGQAIGNLLKNAVEAIQARRDAGESGFEGRVTLNIIPQKATVLITITDTGIGLPAEGRRRLFEPYVTHRDQGTGLGLSIVKKIIEDHGGTLVLRDASHQEGGAEVAIQLPCPTASNPQNQDGTDHD